MHADRDVEEGAVLVVDMGLPAGDLAVVVRLDEAVGVEAHFVPSLVCPSHRVFMTKPLSAGQYLKSAGFQSGNVSEYALASMVDALAVSSGNSLNRKPGRP